jgi:hypothetical protein
MLSRLALVMSIVMIWLVVILFSHLTEVGLQKEKLVDSHQSLTTSSDSIDIDIEIMRRVHRIGSSTSTGFVKLGDMQRD